MRLLFTGRGTSGSWAIRGEQLGGAMGARVARMASLEDCKWADVIVAVKRLPADLLQRIRQSGRPWIYDIVDAYPQPACSTWNRQEAVSWAQAHLAALAPSAVVWPCRQMSMDVSGEMEGKVIYHHHRPGIRRNPVRGTIKKVGYEGSPGYIQGWLPELNKECRRIGAEFVLNPADLADVDVVLALRDEAHAGHPQRCWKSNVKLANAHGSGTPFIGMPEPGYEETATGLEHWATNATDLGVALEHLQDKSSRERVSERFLQSALSIDRIAREYRQWIEALRF